MSPDYFPWQVGLPLAALLWAFLIADACARRSERERGDVSTRARKARKRAGVKFVKAQKVASRPWSSGRPAGLGLVTGVEILASLVVAGRV